MVLPRLDRSVPVEVVTLTLIDGIRFSIELQ